MKKFLVLIPIIFFAFFIFRVNSYAQSPAPIRDVETLVNEVSPTPVKGVDLGTNPDVPRNLNTITQGILIEVTSAASCLLSGIDPIRPDQPCLGFDPVTKKIGYVEKNNLGAIGMMGNLITMTYNIPASSGEYVRYMAGNFGVTQKATAQSFGTGSGFESLRPLLNIWTVMRNLVYLLFVFIFIVLGLGIMFRLQIDPRAVLSIQSQLPKIVIALILVTFSYAIAGFLVDMMYLSLFLIINVFQSTGINAQTAIATDPINAVGNLGGVSGIAYDASKGIAGAMTTLFDGSIGQWFKGAINVIFGIFSGPGAAGGLIGGIAGGVLFPFGGPISVTVGALIGGAAGGLATQLFGFGGPEPFTIVVGAIAWLIIAIALFSALFRLWFILLKTYITILIQIIFAPIWIGFGLFPGSSMNFSGWFRSLVANLAAFPIVLILFSLGKTLQEGFSSAGPNSFVPPFTGNPGDMGAFAGLIGMGIVLLAPEAVNIAKNAIKAPETKLGSAIGEPLGTGQSVVGGLFGSARKTLWHTNPYTNEPSRFKAAVKGKASETLDKIPQIKKFRERFNSILPDRDERNRRREEAARVTANRERGTF